MPADMSTPNPASSPVLCMSQGPRIGSQGCPYCKIPKWIEHDVHRPHPDDGWGPHDTWRDMRPTPENSEALP